MITTCYFIPNSKAYLEKYYASKNNKLLNYDLKNLLAILWVRY